MKTKLPILVVVILSIPFTSKCQYNNGIEKKFQRIVNLIRADNFIELSDLVNYPLYRENPIPVITTKKEFVSRAASIFDSAFKSKLGNYNDSIVFEHNGAYGLVGGQFEGDIWVDDYGKIISINYQS